MPHQQDVFSTWSDNHDFKQHVNQISTQFRPFLDEKSVFAAWLSGLYGAIDAEHPKDITVAKQFANDLVGWWMAVELPKLQALRVEIDGKRVHLGAPQETDDAPVMSPDGAVRGQFSYSPEMLRALAGRH